MAGVGLSSDALIDVGVASQVLRSSYAWGPEGVNPSSVPSFVDHRYWWWPGDRPRRSWHRDRPDRRPALSRRFGHVRMAMDGVRLLAMKGIAAKIDIPDAVPDLSGGPSWGSVGARAGLLMPTAAWTLLEAGRFGSSTCGNGFLAALEPFCSKTRYEARRTGAGDKAVPGPCWCGADGRFIGGADFRLVAQRLVLDAPC
jgi:hypothetical protein